MARNDQSQQDLSSGKGIMSSHFTAMAGERIREILVGNKNVFTCDTGSAICHTRSMQAAVIAFIIIGHFHFISPPLSDCPEQVWVGIQCWLFIHAHMRINVCVPKVYYPSWEPSCPEAKPQLTTAHLTSVLRHRQASTHIGVPPLGTNSLQLCRYRRLSFVKMQYDI